MIKKIGACVGTIGLMMALLTPIALAEGNDNGTSTRGNTAANLCLRIADQVVGLANRVSDRVGRVDSDKGDKVSKLNDAWSKFEGDRQNSRDKEDTNLSARLSKLSETGRTDAQKQAIAVFQAAVQNALQAKRTAIDAATKVFHDGVDNLMNSRNAAVSSTLLALKAAFQTASDKVKADCAAGVNAKTVRTTFLNAVKNAQKSYDAAKKSQNDFSFQMKALTDAKQVAFKKAQDDFKSAVNQAKNALKAVLGENTATSTDH